MRVAYVINSLEGGGASAPIPAIVAVLQSHGCEVRVFALAPRDRRGLPAIEQAGIPVVMRNGGTKDHFAALRWLDREMLAWQPDLIWTSLTRATLLGQIVGQLHRIDVISWQHAAFLKPLNAFLLRLRQGRSLLWVADSRNVAAWAGRKLGIAPDRIAVWPLFSADDTAPQARPWQPGTPLRIGSLGRLHRVKGYDVLIDALAQFQAESLALPEPIEVEIAGDGELRAELTARAAAAGLQCLRFVGFTPSRDFLASLHLYLQPSRSEGLCIAAHEAMQAGLPVIASSVGELPHSIVEGQTGCLIPPGDSAALAQALSVMLRDPARLAVMGAAGRARLLDRFGGDAFAQAGANVLQRIKQAPASVGAPGAGRYAASAPEAHPSSRRST